VSNGLVARLAIALQTAYVLAVFGGRSWAQRRSTGQSGFRLRRIPGARSRGPSALVAAGALTILAGTAAAASSARRAAPIRCLGLAGMALGLAGTLRAQRDIGRSWRIGVDTAERTELVTRGLYRLARNPLFSFMILAALSSAVAVPTPVTAAGAAAVAVGAEMQTRLVEEPHLRRAHGDSYLSYARRTGRFFPGIGRLP
jgi:protein-S-isoprenylcysteine O-methyltransferase Ste14